jgi:hypothetical protein
LPKIGSGLVLALDELDLIGQNPGLEADFFGLLRALHEEGRFKKEKELQKISFIIAHSFEFHLTDINQ